MKVHRREGEEMSLNKFPSGDLLSQGVGIK